MNRHGVYGTDVPTSVATPVVAESGIPFVVGVAPVQSATDKAKTNVPVLCTSWDEAVAKMGYSDNWDKYTLCEFMYSHFKLFGCQPVIFCNVLDITKHKEAVEAEDMQVVSCKITLPIEAIDDETLVVKADSAKLTKGTDYATYVDGESLVIEVLKDGKAYEAASLNVAYNKVDVSAVTTTDIAKGLEAIELCMTKLGMVPDLICAPGYSHDATVAALMATKAESINGLFGGNALVDIDCSATGAVEYSKVVEKKNSSNITDSTQIPCWPMVKLGDKKFHKSTQLAGLIAKTDAKNGGCPYESPSNKNIECDGLVLKDGTEVDLTLAQANMLNANGVVTAINFVNGFVSWGNYTACYPASTDVKDYFISHSRMFKWVKNTLIKTFWTRVDNPMNRRLIDTIVDSCNIWLNGLVAKGYLLGARVAVLESENSLTDLMAGKIKFHVYMTPPSPAQEIEFAVEYDASYVTSALS